MQAIVSQVLHDGILTDPTKLYGFLSAITQIRNFHVLQRIFCHPIYNPAVF